MCLSSHEFNEPLVITHGGGKGGKESPSWEDLDLAELAFVAMLLTTWRALSCQMLLFRLLL